MLTSWLTYLTYGLAIYVLTRLLTGEYVGPWRILSAIRFVLGIILRGLTDCFTCTSVFFALLLTIVVSQTQALTLLDWLTVPLSIAGVAILLDEAIITAQGVVTLLGETKNGGENDALSE